MGNAITTAAGFLLASHGGINLGLLLATLAGLSLVIACGCVLNNYFDRDIDTLMERTKDRVLVRGLISARNVFVYAAILGIFGFVILLRYTNLITTAVAFFGLLMYVIAYTLWAKRRFVHSTVIGGFAGAVPPVVGYCAVSNSLDVTAIILFVILILWQIPHFFAIGLYRLDDYTAARIPIVPVKRGTVATKIQMLYYISAFVVAVSLLTLFGFTGYLYLSVMSMIGLAWLGLCIRGFWAITADDTKHWARKMFLFSLIVIVMFCVMVGIDRIWIGR